MSSEKKKPPIPENRLHCPHMPAGDDLQARTPAWGPDPTGGSNGGPGRRRGRCLVHDSVSVTFSESMDTASAEGALSLSDGTADVEGTLSWSGDTMSLDPRTCLTHGTAYQLKLTTATRNSSENHLEKEFITHFTTSDADPAAPCVIGISPADMAAEVPADTAIAITFSECMDREAAQGAFSLSDRVAQVKGTLQLVGRHNELSADGRAVGINCLPGEGKHRSQRLPASLWRRSSTAASRRALRCQLLRMSPQSTPLTCRPMYR